MGTSLYYPLYSCVWLEFSIIKTFKWKRNSQRNGRKEKIAQGWLCILWAGCRNKTFYVLGTSPLWRGRDTELRFLKPTDLPRLPQSPGDGEVGPGWEQGQQEGWQGGGLKHRRGSGTCWQTPDTPLHPAVADLSSMPSFCSLGSLQKPLVAMTMRDLDVSCQGLMIPLSCLTVI